MDTTYKIIIAVVAGLFVFYIMKTMTKWAFRIIIALLFIAGLFYMYLHVDDMKAIFTEEMSKEPVVSNVSAVNLTETNITEEQAAASQPEGALPGQPAAEPVEPSAEPPSA